MRWSRGCLLGTLLLLGGPSGRAAGNSPLRAFEESVAPVLAKHCVGCHNAGEARGGLDLTHRGGLLQGGKSGPAVVAGNPQASLFIERVAAGTMPPKKSG